jgi:NADPH2:quinone reductase
MQAIEVTRFGGPQVLTVTQRPEPEVGTGQVLINVAYADVTMIDVQLRQGRHADFFGLEPPYVPGGGVGGTVKRIGGDVDPALAGRQVVALTQASGGYAEQAVADSATVVPVPHGLALRTAAALVHDGRTALALVDSTGIHAGERVLVVAAAGGLGILLIQLARAAGALVIGAAKGEPKLEAILAHGAHHVVDYGQPGWADKVVELTGGDGPNVVFDGAGGALGAQALAVLSPGGRFSAHGAAGGEFTTIDRDEAQRRHIVVRGIEQAQLSTEEGRQWTTQALAETANGRIKPLIGQTWPLTEAAQAHAAIEARSTIGKTLLTV